jgi:hypothetical protein
MIRSTALAGALALAALAPAAAHAAPKRVPLYMTLQKAPAPVTGTDGRRHLVYEYTVGNDAGAPAVVESITVRSRGRALLRLDATQIPKMMATFAFTPTNTLGATEGGHMWFDVTLPRRGRAPRALVTQMRVRVPGVRTVSWVMKTPLSPRRPVVLGPPLRGGRYMNFNGCCDVSAHRSAIVSMSGAPRLSERFAIDLIQVDEHGAGGTGDLSRNESFFTFGEPVLAVADARVVSAVDGVPENVPLTEPPASSFSERTIAGNAVILALGHGRYAAYGHMKTGGVRVHPGQRVHRGQVIGLVGNTGPSGGPHLHFQIMDRPSFLAAEGLPFVFRDFRLDGAVTNLDQFLTGAAPADIVRVPRVGARHGELPLQYAVVSFPRR